jgi:hypothetical protein
MARLVAGHVPGGCHLGPRREGEAPIAEEVLTRQLLQRCGLLPPGGPRVQVCPGPRTDAAMVRWLQLQASADAATCFVRGSQQPVAGTRASMEMRVDPQGAVAVAVAPGLDAELTDCLVTTFKHEKVSRFHAGTHAFDLIYDHP